MSENELKEVEDVEEEEFTATDDTDWKARAEELERKRREEGIRNRERTKTLKAQLDSLQQKSQDKIENKGLDYGQLAYLEAKGVPEEDHDFLLKEVAETGKGLKDVLSFKYVQEELRNRKEGRETKAALPTSKRSSAGTRDDVSEWIARGEMPSRRENPELYRKVRKEIAKKNLPIPQ